MRHAEFLVLTIILTAAVFTAMIVIPVLRALWQSRPPCWCSGWPHMEWCPKSRQQQQREPVSPTSRSIRPDELNRRSGDSHP